MYYKHSELHAAQQMSYWIFTVVQVVIFSLLGTDMLQASGAIRCVINILGSGVRFSGHYTGPTLMWKPTGLQSGKTSTNQTKVYNQHCALMGEADFCHIPPITIHKMLCI